MAHYIDGFVLPIPRSQLHEYQSMAQEVAKIWRDHGALEYKEYVGDDMNLDGTRSFVEVVSAKDEEVVIYGWVVFETRESRDVVNKKVAEDPRMEALINSSKTGFDAKRMFYGGFKSLVE